MTFEEWWKDRLAKGYAEGVTINEALSARAAWDASRQLGYDAGFEDGKKYTRMMELDIPINAR